VSETIVRWVRAFGHFWWDFLVGDTPELFVAMLVLVGVAFGLRHDRVAAVVTLPVLAILALLGSAWRGRARVRKRQPAEES
jgi:hypothetical protein